MIMQYYIAHKRKNTVKVFQKANCKKKLRIYIIKNLQKCKSGVNYLNIIVIGVSLPDFQSNAERRKLSSNQENIKNVCYH